MDYTHFKHTAGIDEVGRGPIAGPVAIGLILILKPLAKKELLGLKDSKKLTKKQRMVWYQKICNWEKEGKLIALYGQKSAKQIDKYGISLCIRTLVKKLLSRIPVSKTKIFLQLDYGIHAPKEFAQKQHKKGDERFPEIALASIYAKERRDSYMREIAKKYPLYGFETHVGYGTKAHYDAIRRYNLTEIHRISFLKGLAKKR